MEVAFCGAFSVSLLCSSFRGVRLFSLVSRVSSALDALNSSLVFMTSSSLG